LYSNDSTNLLTIAAPSVRKADLVTRLAASVEEARGAKWQLLQPGNGWTPWWRSNVYPADEHYRWFQRVSGIEPDEFGQHMLRGGDLVRDFIKAARLRGIEPLLSLRLNDYHGSETWDFLREMNAGGTRGDVLPFSLVAMASQSRPLLERRDRQLHPDPADYLALSREQRVHYIEDPRKRIKLRTARVWNWADPAVPALKLAFVRELCAYNLAGLELDFMRWSAFFRLNETTPQQRATIMLQFIRDVRAELDRSTPAGRRRSLGVRVPSRLSGHDPLGIDLPAWVEAGVDWVNLSCHYVSEQQTDLAKIHALIPRTPLYLELTFASTGRLRGHVTVMDGGRELTGYRLMTVEQLTTAAHLAYSRGGYGVSLFNFVYYRNLGPTPHEPPFAVLAKLNDPEWVGRQPQHYFLSESGNPPSAPSVFTRNKRLRSGEPHVFELDAAPPIGGWRHVGRLRVEAREPMGDSQLRVRFNGVVLTPVADVSAPYLTNDLPMAGDARTHRAWTVPPEQVQDGVNEIEIVIERGEPMELIFIDLALPAG
jgi:hypothetical protein